MVSVEAREKVLSAVQKLNYVPNESARRLKQFQRKKMALNRTGNLGCVVFASYKYSDPYFSKVLEGIDEEVIRAHRHLAYVYTESQLTARPELLVNKINPEQVDGLLAVGIAAATMIQTLKRRVQTIITVDGTLDESLDSIEVEKIEAAYNAVRYLAGLGHRRIGFIGDYPGAEARYVGYAAAMRDLGLQENPRWMYWERCDWYVEHGYAFMQRILARGQPLPTAVFAASDSLAIGAMRAIAENHLNVPDDISVIGYNDIDEARYSVPPLTTMRVRKQEMGKLAVRRLLERIENPGMPPLKTMLHAELVERASCRRIV